MFALRGLARRGGAASPSGVSLRPGFRVRRPPQPIIIINYSRMNITIISMIIVSMFIIMFIIVIT